MRSIHTISIVTAFCLSLLACDNVSSGNTTSDNPSSTASSSKSANPEDKGGNKCLLGYQVKYDQLLSQDDVLQATGFDKAKLKGEYLKHMSNPNYHEYRMSFENGRVGKIPGTEKVYEQEDYISVRYIDAMSLKEFKYNYKAPTDEEIQVTNDIIADAVDGKIEDPDAAAAVKKLEDQNVSKENIKKTGSSLNSTFGEMAKGYINIDNLGDAAAWNTKSFELHVLQNGVKFTLISNISNDMERNKEAAITLAKIILNKCK